MASLAGTRPVKYTHTGDRLSPETLQAAHPSKTDIPDDISDRAVAITDECIYLEVK